MDNQRLIAFVLKKAGAEVTIVENGQSAMEISSASRDAGRPFDVILMDIQMPVMDGYTATSRLRAQCYRGAIIGLTAHTMAGDREKCLAAGCDEYATKPIDRAGLVALVAGLLEAAVVSLNRRSFERAAPQASRSIALPRSPKASAGRGVASSAGIESEFAWAGGWPGWR